MPITPEQLDQILGEQAKSPTVNQYGPIDEQGLDAILNSQGGVAPIQINPVPPPQQQQQQKKPPNYFQRGRQYGDRTQKDRWDERLDRIGRTGVTPGNAIEGAAVEIEMKNAERDANGMDRLSQKQTEAIMDNWKRQSGRTDTSNTNFYEQVRRKARESEGEGSVAGRFRQAGAAAADTIGQTAFGLIGTVAPETAAGLREEYRELLNYDSGRLSSKAGQLFGEGVKALTTAKLGAAGAAAAYGAQGFGSTRADVADQRASGEDVSLGAEFAAAIGIGATEAVSGYVSQKLFGAFGNQLKTMSPLLREVFRREGQAGLKPIIKKIVDQAGRLAGSSIGEGAEEAATQVVTNMITKGTIDESQEALEGVGQAGVFGALLSPFGGAGVVGSTQALDPEVQRLTQAIMPHADNNPVLAEMVAEQVKGLTDEGGKVDLEMIGGMIESARHLVPAASSEPLGKETSSFSNDKEQQSQAEAGTKDYADTVAPGVQNNAKTTPVQVTETVEAALNEIEGATERPQIVEAATREQKEALAVFDRLGVEAVMAKGAKYQGLTHDLGGKPVVFINENLEGSGLRQVVSHEVSRALEIDKLPIADQGKLDEYKAKYLERLEAAVEAGDISEQYLADFKANPEQQAQGGAALLIGEIFKSPTAFRRLSGQQPTLVQKIVDTFVGIKQKLTGESTIIDKVLGAIDATIAKRPEIEGLQSELDRVSRESRENPLTGGLNRRAFDEAVAKGKQENERFSVVAFDAANLKAVNDKLGDAAGDLYLKEVMEAIQGATRAETDVRRADAFHYGGDEFAVIAWGAGKKDAEQILARAEEKVGRQEVVPGVSRFLVGNIAEHNPGSDTDVLAEATRGLKARKINMKKKLGEATSRQEADAAVTAKRESAERAGNYLQTLIKDGMRPEALARLLAQQTGGDEQQIQSDIKSLFLPKATGRRLPKTSASKLRSELTSALLENPKITGRPELANPGKKEAHRRLVDVVDAHLEASGYPKPQKVRQWKSEAKKILKDPGRRKEVETALKTGTALQSGSQTVAAIELYNEAADKAMKAPNAQNLSEAATLATGYRLGRTETARVMRAGVDQMKTPAQRMAEFARRSMTTPPSKVADSQKRYQDQEGWDPEAGKSAPLSPEMTAWAEDVAGTLAKWKKAGIDPAKLDEAVAKSARTQYRLIRDAQMIDAKHGSGFWSPIQEYYRNSIMSAPLTFIRNVTGGAHAVSDLFVVQPLRGLIESAIPGKKTQTLPAAARAISAAMDPVVWARGMANAAMSIYYEQPTFDIQTQGLDPLKVDRPVAITGSGTKAVLTKMGAPSIGKAAGKVIGGIGRTVRIPQLLNMAVDQIVKTIHGHATVAREAYLIGEQQGLSGNALEGFVSAQMADMGSPSWSAAIATGDTDRVAFQAELGAMSGLLVKAREAFPPLGLVFPFIKTPTNIYKESFWATPGLGLVGLVGKGLTKKGNRAEYTTRAAQQLMGLIGLSMLWPFIGGEDDEEPLVTGPASYARRHRQERRGKEQTQPPMTVKVGDTRFSYRNIEPYSTVIGSLVAIGEEAKRAMADKQPAKDASTKAFQRLSSVYTDLPAMKAIGDFAKWLEDPEYYAGRWWLTVGTGWMPNLYRSQQRAQDDLVRESRPTGEAGEKASPGLRLWRQMAPYGDHLAPPRTTIFGTEVQKDRADRFDGWNSMMIQRMFNPFVIRSTPKDEEGRLLRMVAKWNEKNKARREQQRWFVEPHRTVQFKTEGTVGNRREELNEKEWHLYMRLSGRMALRAATNQTWNFDNPTVRDVRLLGRIMEGSRENVRKALTAARRAKALGRGDEYNRIIGTLERRLAAIDGTQ